MGEGKPRQVQWWIREYDHNMNDLLLSYYGDDFTGSTDVMESMTFAGLRTVLFLEPPTAEQVSDLRDVRGVGVAGRTRSMRPEEAQAELRPVFEAFRELDAPLVHYKTCSTFDSSPEIGSVGRAIDVGWDVHQPSYVPLVLGAPILRRYCAFGNLFASSGLDSEIFRLDRHPTMSRHPTTPMDEADVRLHLGRQTDRAIGLVDLMQLHDAAARIDSLKAAGCELVLFDTVSESDLPLVGQAIWDGRTEGHFLAGSSGAEYALVAHWRSVGELDEVDVPSADPVEQVAVASGSCSPVTAGQLDWAEEKGFRLISVQSDKLVDEDAQGEIDHTVTAMVEAISQGASVIAHTGRGPDDPRIATVLRVLSEQGLSGDEARAVTAERIGSALGQILGRVVQETGLKRVATTGGDTSYYVAKEMGVSALEAVAPMAPGSPLCRVISPGSAVDGCEVVFKGGQVGRVDFFGDVVCSFPG
ncbi:MAG: hypothetical protein CME19_24750 [Gemmatimonadetes bacterium]|nr:hypothetical protein [Gemmatimonadota bacterium]